MLYNNVPIEMISKCSVQGDIIPLKLRLEGEVHQLMTALIEEIVYKKENDFAGVKTFDYGCKVCLEEREQFIEVRYHVASHKWTIKRVLC